MYIYIYYFIIIYFKFRRELPACLFSFKFVRVVNCRINCIFCASACESFSSRLSFVLSGRSAAAAPLIHPPQGPTLRFKVWSVRTRSLSDVRCRLRGKLRGLLWRTHALPRVHASVLWESWCLLHALVSESFRFVKWSYIVLRISSLMST